MISVTVTIIVVSMAEICNIMHMHVLLLMDKRDFCIICVKVSPCDLDGTHASYEAIKHQSIISKIWWVLVQKWCWHNTRSFWGAHNL